MTEKLRATDRRRVGGRIKRFCAVAAAFVFGTSLLVSGPPAAAQTRCATISITSSITGLLVSAEITETGAFNGMLRARATSLGPWERFRMCYIGDTDAFTLRSNANGRYVTTEVNYQGVYQYMLRARATAVGPWEQFVRYNYPADQVGFTGWPSYWVTAEYGFTGPDRGMLISNRRTRGPWETWMFNVISIG